MGKYIIAFGLFLLVTLHTQAQSLKIDDVSLNVVKDGKIELLIDKISGYEEVTRVVHIRRILENPYDTKTDVTDIELGSNDYNLTWDGVRGTYEMTVTRTKNGKTVIKTGYLKFI